MSVDFGKTKLVKLLYLIDAENYRGRRLQLLHTFGHVNAGHP